MKKLLLLMLALSLALSMAYCASAADTIIVTPGSGSESDDEEEEVSTYETLAEAIEAALDSEEDEVVINIASDAAEDQRLEETFPFDDSSEVKSITIIGAGTERTRITVEEGYRHFHINNPDFTLGLANLTIHGRNSGGGVLVTAGTLSADHVTFRGGSTSRLEEDEDLNDTMGGIVALKGEDAEATFATCSFYDNASTNGGAVYIDASAKASFTGNPYFHDNIASGSGGAIYSAGTLTFEDDGTFETNSASSNGGAIALIGSKTSSFTGLSFGAGTSQRANHAQNGGAVYIAGGNVTFSGSVFDVNSADAGGNGGALYVDTGILTLDSGCTLTGNKAQNGGAVYISPKDGAELKFTGEPAMTFRDNEAAEAGGAIYSGQRSGLSAAGECTFDTNHAVQGGALWVWAGTQLNRFEAAMTFTGNTADYGGAIYVASDAQSRAVFSSGAGYTFSGNEAAYDGGAIYTVKADVTVSGLEISTANTAGGGGGFLKAGGTAAITSSTISNQKAAWGGAVYSDGTVTIENSGFSQNSAETEDTSTLGGGGAVYVAGDLTITGSSFDRNSSTSNAVGHGGGAVWVNGTTTITGTSFVNNVHTNNANTENGGGALYAAGELTLTEVTFDTNRAAGSGGSRGGALFATGGATVTITDTLFVGNTANTNGGAVALSGQCETNIDKSTFRNNAARSGWGGGIYAQGVIGVRNSYFVLNRAAHDGGAVYLNQQNNADNPGSITAEYCMFTENSAGIAPNDGQGGAMYLKPDVASINRCTFTKNQSAASGGDALGGAVYLDTTNTAAFTASTVKNSTFGENSASGGANNYGGALYLTGTDLAIVSCTFALNNTAANRGGAVYLGSGTLSVAATLIVGNAAEQGRDIYAEGTITSRGYNRIGVYGKGGNDTSWKADVTNSNTDRENSSWTTVTFFGEEAVLTDNDGSVQAPVVGSALEEPAVYLLALPLNEIDGLSEADRATNAIPFARRFTLNIDERDIWGISRFQGGNDISIGAHYLGGAGGGAGNDDGYYDIESITMSGIPNTLKSIGQTASLVAVIKYRNDRTAYGVPASRETVVKNQEERITWKSSLPNFVKVDEYGNITALQMTNNTNGAIITVKTVRPLPSGASATDSRAVRVTGQYSNLNVVSPTYQNYFTGYVQDIMEHDISVALADPDRSTIVTTGFQRNFASVWNGARANTITELNTSTPRFDTKYSYSNSEGLAASNGAAVNITFQDRSTGDLFPLTYSWNLTGEQVKALLGADMTNQAINDAFATRFFSKARIDYQTAAKSTPVIGGSGVSGSDARRYSALEMTKADSNRGLHIELTAYLANVKTSGTSDGPQLVRGSGTRRILVVPDNADDGAITGTMWLVQSSGTVITRPDNSNGNSDSNGNSGGNTDSNSNGGGNSTNGNANSSGGGGGGGCSTLPLGIMCAGVLLFHRKH